MSKSNEDVLTVPIDLVTDNIAVYRYEEDGFVFVDFNESAQKTEQISKDELIGKKLIDVFPGAKDLGLVDVLERVHFTGRKEELELGFYEDERIKGWRSNILHKLPNGDILVIYKDLSESKEIQSRIESLAYIVDNSTVEVFIFDIESFKFSYINKEAQRNTGYSLKEMQSMTPVDIKPEYNEYNFKKLMKPMIDGEEDSFVFETIHQRKDGTLYNVELYIKVMEFNHKKEFVVFAHDITNKKESQKALLESEEKFRLITENSSMGIFIYQEHFVYVNEAFCKIVGFSKEELYKMEPWKIVSEDLQESFKEISIRRIGGEHFSRIHNDVCIVCKSSDKKHVRVLTQTINYQGGFAGLGSMVDVTDLKETKQQLKILAQAVEQTDEMIRIVDKNGIITYVNEALVAHSGYRSMELVGKSMDIFKSDKQDESFYKNLWKTILSGSSYHNVIINKKKNNELYYEEETITPVVDENNEIEYFVSTSHDITERIEMENQLQRLASIDSLTSLYNRHKINEELDLELARAKRYDSRFSILMFDVDNFKLINDTYGHDVGDEVLVELSKIVSDFIRQSDILGRWGGEEFIIISPVFEKDNVIKFANKVKELVSTYNFHSVEKVTISTGATVYYEDDDKESLLKRVDNLMYKAKEGGRNLVVFE